MESSVSVSKGVFLFSNGFKRVKNNTNKSKESLFEKTFVEDVWYKTFKTNWSLIENELKSLHHNTYNVLLNDIVSYVEQAYHNHEALDSVIPCATLLTGISQPDHVSQFTALIDMIRKDVTEHVAVVNSQDGSSIKHLIENAVLQLINGQNALDKKRMNHCTMKTLKNWYSTTYITTSKKVKPLVIIIPDFESFNCNVLQDFVMIVSSYVRSLPIVVIFGVATSVSALHKSFPYHVSSKLLIKVFHTHSSPVYLNIVLENIFLTNTSPFHVSGKAFELLSDVFLFYDFSVTGMIQSIKYCMMEHYYCDNRKSLCCSRDNLEEAIANLTSEDMENIRSLLSFRRYIEDMKMEDCRTKIRLLENDMYLKEFVHREMCNLHDYLHSFYLCVRLLCIFVKDMPRNVMGKTVREIYAKCVNEYVINTQGFKDSMQLLGFQSQMKLIEIIKSALKVVNASIKDMSPVEPPHLSPTENNTEKDMSPVEPPQLSPSENNTEKDLSPVEPPQLSPTENNTEMHFKGELGVPFSEHIRVDLLTFLRDIENANTEATILKNNAEAVEHLPITPVDRYTLKEALLKATKVDRVQSEFEMVRSRFVNYLQEMFAAGLRPPHSQPLHEILFFSDVAAVKQQIVGAPRGALHTALTNPAHYLQCTCCRVGDESLTGSLPDVCIAYKLLRECGKHVNLFDWLQAFTAVLHPGTDDRMLHSTRSRFLQAVAVLQFLGFIRSSKRKTDHVIRVTS